MSLSAFERYLGVDESADAATLLGLADVPLSRIAIEAALRERLERVFQHPDGRSGEAEIVRAALRGAAQELLSHLESSRPSATAGVGIPAVSGSTTAKHPARLGERRRHGRASRPLFNLTTFDRLALAALVAHGGWNAASRGRLVALASMYGLTVQGLLRVIQGLSEYARTGGPRLGVAEITAGRALPPLSGGGTAAAPFPFERAAVRLGEELRRGGPWPIIKLSLIFGAITLIAGIAILKALVGAGGNSDRGARSSEPARVVAAAPAAPAVVSVDRPRTARALELSAMPTFVGNGRPARAVQAAEECTRMHAELQELGRKLEVNEEPSAAVFHRWGESIRSIGCAWPLIDREVRSQLEGDVGDALRAAADRPSVTDKLLAAITPGARVVESLDIWRGAWRSGLLALIAESQTLPPAVVYRARAQLELMLSLPGRTPHTFESAARAWLDGAVQPLVAGAVIDESAYESWELWLIAQRALGRTDAHDSSVMKAIQKLLATDTDLSRPGPALNVLGRLVSAALEHPGRMVRERTLAILDDKDITPRDLWVFTSVIAKSGRLAWFNDSLVLPEDADERHRWRVRDEIASRWPAPRGEDHAIGAAAPLQVDGPLSQQWSDLLDQLVAAPLLPAHENVLLRLVLVSRMNEAAAALATQKNQAARIVLDDVVRKVELLRSGASAKGSPDPLPARPAPGQPLGRDGEWAQTYQQLGRNSAERSESLRALRTSAGTDLGPVDAEVFVREVYRGAPAELRTLAQSVLVQRFASGPNVVMAMLEQFADAPAVDSIAETIQTLTGATLPQLHSAIWPNEARLALLRHALSLRGAGNNEIDAAEQSLARSYAAQVELLAAGRGAALATGTSAQDAAAALERGLQELAALQQADSADGRSSRNMTARQRTRLLLANGPIERFIVHQLGVLESMATLAGAEHPALRNELNDRLAAAAARRAEATTSPEQSLAIERAIAEIWRIRLGFNAGVSVGTGGAS